MKYQECTVESLKKEIHPRVQNQNDDVRGHQQSPCILIQNYKVGVTLFEMIKTSSFKGKSVDSCHTFAQSIDSFVLNTWAMFEYKRVFLKKLCPRTSFSLSRSSMRGHNCVEPFNEPSIKSSAPMKDMELKKQSQAQANL